MLYAQALRHLTTSDGTETRNLVFATMPSDLGAAEKPLARVVGSLNDRAGNITSTGDEPAVDGIEPKLTTTVTGEASSRPIASGKTGVKVTVRVVSDEALSGPPTVTFSTLTETSTTSPFVSAGGSVAVPATAVTGFVSTWEATRILTQAPTSGKGLVNVHISGKDPSANQGTAGVGPTGLVDLSKAILFEFDNQLNGGAAPTFKLTPRVGETGTAATQTESTKPFIRVDLNGEGTEYNVGTGDLDGDGNNDKVTIGTKTVELDSHNGVTRTVVKLDGVDILGTANVGTIDSNSFQVSTAGLALGTHTLEVNATDDVGNTSLVNFKFTFTVIARRAHSVGMVPGFSQVSFPAEPVDPDINVVLAGNPAITAVLTYDPLDPAGPWLVATRAPNIVAGIVLPGKLEGTLKTIDGRHAYWIQTTTFDPIKTVLAEPDFTSPPTAIPLVAGWNLVPVTDVQLAKIGTMILADTYFASATWTVAYHFDSSSNKWIKVIPGDAQSVKSGQGWWLFVTESGNLVP